MQILNLTNIDRSDIKYDIRKYPDGQQDIVIFPSVLFDSHILIVSRFNSFKDLELIICAVKSLKRIKIDSISLSIPYLLGARSDRQFQEGGNSYLVDVIAPIINSLGLTSVTSYDVHSDVAAACINNFYSKSNLELVKYAMGKIGGDHNIIISPDAGSEKKIYNILNKISFSELVVARKHRDILTGNITSTEVPLARNFSSHYKKYIIIDDICDGGRTFIEIAKALRNNSRVSIDSSIILIVTHGIFSAGFKELSKYFTHIFCTNSVRDIGDLDGNDLIKTNVTQLNIF